MATAAQWIEGARPRTLPAAIAPVLMGAAVATVVRQGFTASTLVRTLLAALVALALQVGVNYANDYSDGVRGTDDDRVGPMRLVGSGAARPTAVKLAAFACFGVGALAGLVLVVLSGHWWLLAVGVASILAAWFYTGGDHPYGYSGLGEVFVFVFFGLVAVCGTHYVITGTVGWPALAGAVGVGAVACNILVANNLRDISSDRLAGKRTLATRLGETGTRWLYAGLALVTVGCVVLVAALTSWWLLLGLACLPMLASCVRIVLGGASGRSLIAVLKRTGQAELALGVGVGLGAALFLLV